MKTPAAPSSTGNPDLQKWYQVERDALAKLVDLTLSATSAPRNQLLAANAKRSIKAWRDALWFIAKEDYGISNKVLLEMFPVARRTIDHAMRRMVDNPCAMTAVNILRAQLARALYGA